MRKLLQTALCLLPTLLTACAPTTMATLEPASADISTDKAPSIMLPLDRSQLRISIAATGDIMPGNNYPQNRLPDDDGIGFYSGVQDELQSADVAFGNFEGSLLDGGEPEKTCNNPNACYLFRSPSHYAQHLANAGFDVISLANNHALDFGEAGRDASIAALESVGIKHSG
ncbi:MAG: CapA family protein, partial [Gammaproteobacteria bacterium]|nr:CapA family protein [Gammaproteobacteria bacterium]